MTQPQPITAQPTPTAWGYGFVELANGAKLLVLDIHTVVGMIRVFVEPASARNIAANLVDAADKAEVPTLAQPLRGLLGPDGNPIYIAPNGTGPSQPMPEHQKPEQVHETVVDDEVADLDGD